MPEQDDRDAIEILKAPLSRAADRDQLKELEFRLMGFATGLALLVVLAPTWFVRDRGTSRIIDVYGGTSLFGLAPEKDAPLGPLGVVLLLGYLVLALSLLLAPAESTYVLVAGIAGLVITLVIVLTGKALSDFADLHWTGAPFVALGIWLLAVFVSVAARSATRF
ncbi:hypothetical protein [Kribbella sp. NBC_00359]|uniref:hypothetical protein n=1 Tax=Kribbella sp. NBC_00359 TaxID=2975966 RepID=UPI002E245CE3